jgi:hypothetical protein
MSHNDSFVASYNDNARPFAWTKGVVHQKRFKPGSPIQRFWIIVVRS